MRKEIDGYPHSKDNEHYTSIGYRGVLRQVSHRLSFIKESSLEDAQLNKEWKELIHLQDILLRLIKLEK